MSDDTDINSCAEAICRAWKSGSQIDRLPDGQIVQSLTEAYAIQDRLDALLKEELAGWKLYASSRAAMRVTRISEPILGRLYEKILYRTASSATGVPVSFPEGEFASPTLEPEFLFRFGKSLPIKSGAYTVTEVMDAVEMMYLGLEITDSRLSQPKECGGLAAITADNAGSGAYIIGPEAKNWRDVDLENLEISLRTGGEAVSLGLTGPSRYVAADVLTWSVNALIERKHSVTAGMLVTTGTLTKPVTPNWGSEYCATFGEIGEISVTLA